MTATFDTLRQVALAPALWDGERLHDGVSEQLRDPFLAHATAWLQLDPEQAAALRLELRADIRLPWALVEGLLPTLVREARDGAPVLPVVALVAMTDGYSDARDSELLLNDLGDLPGFEAACAAVVPVCCPLAGSWIGSSTRTTFERRSG